MTLEQIGKSALGFALALLPKLLFAILIFVVGHFLIKLIVKIMDKTLAKFHLDPSLVSFLENCVRVALYVVLALVILSTLGIPTAGIIAAFSACAAAIALALKDSLSNIASGITLLFTRPFGTGDFVQIGDESGTVMRIDLMHTKLCAPDNKHIIVPNGQMATSEVINYSVEEFRRVELIFNISYDNDLEKAKEVIMSCIRRHPAAILNDEGKEPFVRVSGYLDSSVKITGRLWTRSGDYWTAYFDLLEGVKKEFDKAGITIPYNQLDVHIKND